MKLVLVLLFGVLSDHPNILGQDQLILINGDTMACQVIRQSPGMLSIREGPLEK